MDSAAWTKNSPLPGTDSKKKDRCFHSNLSLNSLIRPCPPPKCSYIFWQVLAWPYIYYGYMGRRDPNPSHRIHSPGETTQLSPVSQNAACTHQSTLACIFPVPKVTKPRREFSVGKLIYILYLIQIIHTQIYIFDDYYAHLPRKYTNMMIWDFSTRFVRPKWQGRC